MKTTKAIIEKGNDGTYGIYPPDIKNVFWGDGNTVLEAKQDFLNSYQEMLDSYTEDNKPIPEELQDLQFEYQYDVSAIFNDNPYLNISSTAKQIGINPSLMRQYASGKQYISKAQVQKIQNGIRAIGRKLAKIQML